MVQSTNPDAAARPSAISTRKTGVLAPALAAILLGAVLIAGAGFAGPDALHNAAHDSRHTISFPCH
jgi:cobalt transporter subunit CbtB